MAKISEGNARSQPVILPARAFRFEIEAILTSFGFDPFCSPSAPLAEPLTDGASLASSQIFQYSSRLLPNPEQNGLKPRRDI
jgi:hypothetical protein